MASFSGPISPKKSHSPSPRSGRLQMAPQLGVGLDEYLCHPCCLSVLQVLCIESKPPWVHVCRGFAISNQYCFTIDAPSWFLQSFGLLFQDNPLSLKAVVVMETSHLELSSPLYYSLHVDQLLVPVLIIIHFIKKHLWWGLRDSIINGYKDNNVGAVYYLVHLAE
jgi:hypothetical protein